MNDKHEFPLKLTLLLNDTKINTCKIQFQDIIISFSRSCDLLNSSKSHFLPQNIKGQFDH